LLKLLACLFMLLDHIGYYFSGYLPDELVFILRSVGRLAFPIFAWSVARGYKRTSHPLWYFIRMSLFATLTQVIFIFIHRMAGLPYNGMNVLVTFSLAIVLLAGFQMALHSMRDMIASLRPISPTPQTLPCATRYDVRVNIGGIELDRRIGLPLGVLMMLAALAAAHVLDSDYGQYGYGLITVLLFYAVHDLLPEKDFEKRALQGFILINLLFTAIRILTDSTSLYWAILQNLSILAVPICYARFDEPRPSVWIKYSFYVFYPLHIVVLLLIRTFVWPG
jgi:hypothetical protein